MTDDTTAPAEDLRAILVERLKDIPTGIDGLECRIPDRRHREMIAAVALSVRWEDNAVTLARLAEAERRADRAEGELSSHRDHETRWETEKARADAAEKRLSEMAMARDVLGQLHDEAVERLREIERVTAPPADELEMPADPAELREMWEFINRQTRWQYHMAHKWVGQVGQLRPALAEAQRQVQGYRGMKDAYLRERNAAHADLIKAEKIIERLCDDREAGQQVVKAAITEQRERAEKAVAELSDLQEERARRKIKLANSEDARRAVEAERDLLRQTLAESDLGAQVLAQWEAIAAADADRDRLQAERDEIKRVTDPPADEEMPTDPAELREMWEFTNRQARWQWHMAHKFGDQVERLRSELAERKANAEGICIDLEQWKARAQLAEAELSDLQERVQKLTATRIGDFRLVPATEILAALAAPETPGAQQEGCDDPDCSRTECLHLGTCWEDAMDPPETTPDAPTTERVGLHEPDWLRARTPGEPPYPRATTTHELSALTGHRDTPSSEASSDAPTGGED